MWCGSLPVGSFGDCLDMLLVVAVAIVVPVAAVVIDS